MRPENSGKADSSVVSSSVVTPSIAVTSGETDLQAVSAEATVAVATNAFDDLGLDPRIVKAINSQGYTNPTAIQAQAVPLALAGNDLLASAQTGTGKTAAFMWPALQLMMTPAAPSRSRGPRVLVLTPTRELAAQVTESARTYGKGLPQISMISILGGVPYNRQREKMRKPLDIMVATPGRLIDYVEQGEIDFSRVEIFILDEADRMLDMGFRDAVKEIAKALPTTRRTWLFSATIDGSISELAASLQRNPRRIEITPAKANHENIEQKIVQVADMHAKRHALTGMLREDGEGQTIVFAATKRLADQLARDLRDDDIQAAALHGDMRQHQRNRTLQRLREGSVRVLVATDVAARGIDIPGLARVVNFDVPRSPQDYVHRIGRTGRAGAKGIAVTLVYPKERGAVIRLEKYLGRRFDMPKAAAHEGSRERSSAGEFKRQDRRPRREMSEQSSEGGRFSRGKFTRGNDRDARPNRFRRDRDDNHSSGGRFSRFQDREARPQAVRGEMPEGAAAEGTKFSRTEEQQPRPSRFSRGGPRFSGGRHSDNRHSGSRFSGNRFSRDRQEGGNRQEGARAPWQQESGAESSQQGERKFSGPRRSFGGPRRSFGSSEGFRRPHRKGPRRDSRPAPGAELR